MTAERTTSMSRKVWLTVIGVFLFGCVTGASLDSVYRLAAGSVSSRRAGDDKDHEREKEARFQEMKSDLKLTDEQARNDFRALRTEIKPRFDAIRQTSRTKIRALLTPEQQQRFDAVIKERDAKHSADEK